ncbi:hypothetical protein ANTQUA_LOCUS9494 [Anthophora quadrimaculata]
MPPRNPRNRSSTSSITRYNNTFFPFNQPRPSHKASRTTKTTNGIGHNYIAQLCLHGFLEIAIRINC